MPTDGNCLRQLRKRIGGAKGYLTREERREKGATKKRKEGRHEGSKVGEAHEVEEEKRQKK